MCCQSNPPRGKSAPCAVTNRWMKRRWKDMKLLRQFCVLLCNRKEKIMQIRKPCENKGSFRTKMIWKIKVRFRTASVSCTRQSRRRQEAENRPRPPRYEDRMRTTENGSGRLVCVQAGWKPGGNKDDVFVSGAPHSRCGRQEDLAHPRPCMAARFYPRICRLVCQQPVHGACTKCGRHFAGFAPAAHLGCSRICGVCGNDC